MNRLVYSLTCAFMVFAVSGCGGSGGSSGLVPVELAEGISPEEVPPEDQDPSNRNLVPPVFVIVDPGAGRDHAGPDWTTWPESLARRVLDENNSYANRDQLLLWPDDGAAGIYLSRADCSGFVTRSLMKAFQFTAADITAWLGSKGPSSARYHENILAGNNFHRITAASDVQRGDIVAIKYLNQTSGGTGHTMIAAGPAVERSPPTSPIIQDTVQYDLPIIDSTKSPHGTGDTRKGTGPDGADQDGAGLGTMRLYADARSGQITGYTWSRSSSSVYYTATSPAEDPRSLVVGRMTFAD